MTNKTALLIDLSNKLLQEEHEINVTLGGVSMWPLIKSGDVAKIQKADINSIVIGDVVVFKYNNRILAHRVIQTESNGFICKGDSSIYKDPFVSFSMILGKIVSINRFGKITDYTLEKTQIKNKLFAKFSPVLGVAFTFLRKLLFIKK